MPRPNKRIKHARHMVASRGPLQASSEDSVVPVPASDHEKDEWLDDTAFVDDSILRDVIRWTPGAQPKTRKYHDGFGRSSMFAKKAKLKKMQVKYVFIDNSGFINI